MNGVDLTYAEHREAASAVKKSVDMLDIVSNCCNIIFALYHMLELSPLFIFLKKEHILLLKYPRSPMLNHQSKRLVFTIFVSVNELSHMARVILT